MTNEKQKSARRIVEEGRKETLIWYNQTFARGDLPTPNVSLLSHPAVGSAELRIQIGNSPVYGFEINITELEFIAKELLKQLKVV